MEAKANEYREAASDLKEHFWYKDKQLQMAMGGGLALLVMLFMWNSVGGGKHAKEQRIVIEQTTKGGAYKRAGGSADDYDDAAHISAKRLLGAKGPAAEEGRGLLPRGRPAAAAGGAGRLRGSWLAAGQGSAAAGGGEAGVGEAGKDTITLAAVCRAAWVWSWLRERRDGEILCCDGKGPGSQRLLLTAVKLTPSTSPRVTASAYRKTAPGPACSDVPCESV